MIINSIENNEVKTVLTIMIKNIKKLNFMDVFSKLNTSQDEVIKYYENIGIYIRYFQ